MNGAANALLWKSSKTQNFTYLTILKHQNTKTSLNELSKNHWVIALFEIFGSVSKKLQSTVFNDHPVLRLSQLKQICKIDLCSSICEKNSSFRVEDEGNE